MKFEAGQHPSPASALVSARPEVNPELFEGTPLERFNFYFEMRTANSSESIRLAQAIRYQVYCVEHPHEKSDNPDGLEIDDFDTHSVHGLLMHRAR